MFSWKGLALFLTVFCVLAAIVGSTQARYPERFPDTAGGILNPAQNQSLDDDVSFCHGDDTDWCCEWDTDGTEGLLCTATDCDGIGTDCNPLHLYQDSGNLIADLKGIDSITNSSQKITFGPPGASSYSLGANDFHVTSSDAEFESYTRFDALVEFKSNMAINSNKYFAVGSSILYIYPNLSQKQMLFALYDTNSGKTLVIGDADYFTKDYDIPAQSIPSIAVTDDTDPDTLASPNASRLFWNKLYLGGLGGGLGCINQTFAYDDMVDGGGTSGTLVLDEGIPDGARVDQSILHSLTGFTGDTSAVITIGDGTDVDRYNTGTPSVFTTNASGCDLGVPSGTAWHDDAKSVTVTITSNSDFTSVSAGEATISICYWTP